MYDISFKNIKKYRNFYSIFLIIGLIFLAIILAIFLNFYLKISKLDSKTTATSIEINEHVDEDGDTMYSPRYKYMVDDIEYTCITSITSSINPTNKSKIIFYDSKNPGNCLPEYSKKNYYFMLLFLILPITFILIGSININKINKKIKMIQELNFKGTLIKNIPYHFENSNITLNGIRIQKPAAYYTLPNGLEVTLYGEPRFDKKVDSDTIDLLIDLENPNNYFIDYEINRTLGNTSSDYYNERTK